MSTILFSYRTIFKVGTGHTPFQLVYGLYPLLIIDHLLPFKLGQIYDPNPIKVLTSHMSELEKLRDNWLIAQDLIASNQWNRSLCSQNWYIEKKSVWRLCFMVFKGYQGTYP
jgi:hypothetical protein